MTFINLTFNGRLVKPFAVIRVNGSELQAASSLSPMVEMGQKGLSMVKVAQWWARISRAILAEAGYLWLWILNKGSPSLIYSWKPCSFRVRVSSSFSSLFYIFYSFLEIFAFLEEFWIFLEEKRVLRPFGGILSLLEAFCMVL